jgi:hypothetical protein
MTREEALLRFRAEDPSWEGIPVARLRAYVAARRDAAIARFFRS